MWRTSPTPRGRVAMEASRWGLGLRSQVPRGVSGTLSFPEGLGRVMCWRTQGEEEVEEVRGERENGTG